MERKYKIYFVRNRKPVLHRSRCSNGRMTNTHAHVVHPNRTCQLDEHGQCVAAEREEKLPNYRLRNLHSMRSFLLLGTRVTLHIWFILNWAVVRRKSDQKETKKGAQKRPDRGEKRGEKERRKSVQKEAKKRRPGRSENRGGRASRKRRKEAEKRGDQKEAKMGRPGRSEKRPGRGDQKEANRRAEPKRIVLVQSP